MAGVTTLGEDCTNDATEINVANASVLSDNELLLIDDEIMIATAFPGEGEVDVTRGVNGARAAAHNTGAEIYPVIHVATTSVGLDIYYKDSSGQVFIHNVINIIPSQPSVYTFEFAHDTPGLSAGIAIPGYTPKVGDIIVMDTLVRVTESWDEPLNENGFPVVDIWFPSADIGYFHETSGLQVIASSTVPFLAPNAQYYHYCVSDDGEEALLVVSSDGSLVTAAATLMGEAPTTPLTIVTGTNDEFVYTSDGGVGTPQTFTLAPGVYTTVAELVTAVGAAIGGSSEAFSTIATPSNDAGVIKLTKVGTGGAYDNGDTITVGVHDVGAALGLTSSTFGGGTGGKPVSAHGAAILHLIVYRAS